MSNPSISINDVYFHWLGPGIPPLPEEAYRYKYVTYSTKPEALVGLMNTEWTEENIICRVKDLVNG